MRTYLGEGLREGIDWEVLHHLGHAEGVSEVVEGVVAIIILHSQQKPCNVKFHCVRVRVRETRVRVRETRE